MWDSLDHDFNDRSPTIPDCVYVCMALNDKCCLRHFHFYYLLFYTIHILRQQQQLQALLQVACNPAAEAADASLPWPSTFKTMMATAVMINNSQPRNDLAKLP